MNYTNRPLDVETTIAIATQLLLIQKGFFLMTDMGRVYFEGFVERNALNPSEVMRWEDSRKSDNPEIRNEIADYYLHIGIHPEASSDYIRVVVAEAVMTVKFMKMMGYKVDRSYVDASVLSYVYEVERNPEKFLSNIEKEFTEIHYRLRPNKTAIELNHYMMKERIRQAYYVQKRADEAFIAKAGDSQFARDVLALTYLLRMSA